MTVFYAVPALITLGVWAGTAIGLGTAAAGVLVMLCLVEWAFSFDNAAVTAPLVRMLSPWWRRIFMTAGILVAVGLVRFIIPVLIVSATSGLAVDAVVDLVVHQPARYAEYLGRAAPVIDAFGGTFLIGIAVAFFADDAKALHWIAAIERRLSRLGRYGSVQILAMLGLGLGSFVLLQRPVAVRAAVLCAAACAVALYLLLDLFADLTDTGEETGRQAPVGRARSLAGAAAAVMFVRLEALDMSFSFDSVMGAFAVTNNVLIIAAGLGIGALWVRALTVHMVAAGTMDKVIFLEHGAHWAIAALGMLMFAKLYGWHPPAVVTGGIGLVFIGASIAHSLRHRRKQLTQVTA